MAVAAPTSTRKYCPLSWRNFDVPKTMAVLLPMVGRTKPTWVKVACTAHVGWPKR